MSIKGTETLLRDNRYREREIPLYVFLEKFIFEKNVKQSNMQFYRISNVSPEHK